MCVKVKLVEYIVFKIHCVDLFCTYIKVRLVIIDNQTIVNVKWMSLSPLEYVRPYGLFRNTNMHHVTPLVRRKSLTQYTLLMLQTTQLMCAAKDDCML
jgi:hypothetical protein